MIRRYRLTLTVDTGQSVVYEGRRAYVAAELSQAHGEVDVELQLRDRLRQLFQAYMDTEKTRPDYWETQAEICKARLADTHLSVPRATLLNGLLENYEKLAKECKHGCDGPVEASSGPAATGS